MAKYVDGFVIPIKKKDLKTYKKMAIMGRNAWMKYGALDYYECVGEELNVPWGLTFPKMCKLKADETVVFAFVIYKSKAHRKQVMKKVDADMGVKMEGVKMPFDMKRFSTGGFTVLVEGKRQGALKKT